MNAVPSRHDEGFDAYATDYDAALQRGISLSGENKDYFARRRLEWTAQCLARRGVNVAAVMDFGCGTGSATPYLLDILKPARVLGVDVSERSLEVARRAHAGAKADYVTFDRYHGTGEMDLVFCNGVFHHIPPADRAAVLHRLWLALRPGGLFALWENNPWNPGTRLVMKRIPFDRDAVMLSPPETQRLLRASGFRVARTDFLFIFPHALSALRWMEPFAARLPLGAQYQVLAQRPSA